MKPRVRPLPKTGDATPYLVTWRGLTKRVWVPGLLVAISGKRPIDLLPHVIELHFEHEATVSRLTAPSH